MLQLEEYITSRFKRKGKQNGGVATKKERWQPPSTILIQEKTRKIDKREIYSPLKHNFSDWVVEAYFSRSHGFKFR